MTTVLGIAWREVNERRAVFGGAAAAALLAVLAPLVPVWQRWGASEVTAASSLVLAGGLAAVLALAIGGSVLAGDLADGRLAFYFSRPLSPVAVWAGKLLGVWVIVLAAGAIAALPAVLVVAGGASTTLAAASLPATFGVAAAAALAVVAIAHVLGVMWRARSAWLAVDLAALLLVAFVVALGVRTLTGALALQLVPWAIVALVAVALAGVAAAGAVATARGRVDLGTTHRVLSATLWATCGIAALGFAGYAHWFVAVTPADLSRVESVEIAPAGSWAAVTGRAPHRRGFHPSLLIDLASPERFWRLGPIVGAEGVAIAADGSRAAWVAVEGARKPPRLVTLDLTTPDAEPSETPIGLESPYRLRLAISRDGARLALIEPDTVSVLSLPDGALLAAARLPSRVDRGWWWGVFDDAELRLVGVVPRRDEQTTGQSPASIATELLTCVLDPDTRDFRIAGRVPLEGPPAFALIVFEGSGKRRFALRRIYGNRRTVTLHDLESGTTIATLVDGEQGGQPLFLADGRIVVPAGDASGRALDVFDKQGRRLRAIPIGPSAGWVRLGGELAPGRLAVAVIHRWAPPRDAEAFIVDLDTGVRKPLEPGLIPVLGSLWVFPPRPALYPPGSLATTLFYDRYGRLVRLDPATGATTPVLGRG